MFSTVRKFALPVALSALFAGAMAGEVVLQNGLNEYDGCKDAFISHGGPIYIQEVSLTGDHDTNFGNENYLYSNFCPS